MTLPFEQFCQRFRFDSSMAGKVGLEQEGFLFDQTTGEIVPRSADLVSKLRTTALARSFSPELSACQVELKTDPCDVDDLAMQLNQRRMVLAQTAAACGLEVRYLPAAPADMPLDVYPDPTGRYQLIAQQIPESVLRAGCRVAGVHGHIGMPDAETALRAYNTVSEQIGELIELGSSFEGERMRLYRSMAPAWRPRTFVSWHELYQYALTEGFVENPRDWWSLIRITIYGTIEFRVFDSIECEATIASWMREIVSLCHNAQ